MTTRLDRLFLLLDTGSTPLIRKSAAEQLGDVQKLHPYELGNLLSKLHGFLLSTNWDTRIAAAQAVNAIARNVPLWDPRGAPKQEDIKDEYMLNGKLLLSTFDVQKVLENGTSLLGSEGAQFAEDENLTGLDERERLVYHRQMLNRRLGLDMAGSLKLGLDQDLYTDDDLLTGMGQEPDAIPGTKQISELISQQLSSGLSARERNQAKRKARLMMKQTSRESPVPDTDVEPPHKKLKTENGAVELPASTEPLEQEDWPFDWFCEQLMTDLFSGAWETRHGAATGLREVVRNHGQGAGKSIDTPVDQMSMVNQLWLSDLALRLMSVIALDRFGDFVSDEVVAPVRETCAQTLGVVMKWLERGGIQGVLGVLLQLLQQAQWEVRHGGLLGIKYLLAVRRDMTDDLLPSVLPYVFKGLQDVDDDVRAVAASALVPVADNLVNVVPDQVPVIVVCLWEILLDLDDLTASTNSIMTLLSTLHGHPRAAIIDRLSKPLSELVPRLWPFLRHNIASVRHSALETILALVNLDTQQHPWPSWLGPILHHLLCHIYQRALFETVPEILSLLARVWSRTLARAPLLYLITGATPWMGVWLSLAMQPSKVPYEQSYLVEAKHHGRASDAVSHRKSSDLEPSSSEPKTHPEYIAGFESLNLSVQERDTVVTRARMTTARIFGELCSYVTRPVEALPPGYEKPVESLAKLLNFHLNTRSAIQRIVVAEVITAWATHEPCLCSDEVKTRVLETLSESIYYDEIALGFTRLQTECKDFISSLKQQAINMDQIVPPGTILSLDQAQALVGQVFDQVKVTIKPRPLATLEERRASLQTTVNQIAADQSVLCIRVQSSLAKAAVRLDIIPEKLNPVIRPLMECVKKEENQSLQEEAAKCLSIVLRKCMSRSPSPNGKVVKNLCGFLCCDPFNTPVIAQPNNNNTSSENNCDAYKGNLTLAKLTKVPDTDRRRIHRASSVKNDAAVSTDLTKEEELVQKQLAVQRRGGEVTLCRLAADFGENMLQELPALWECISKHLLQEDIEVSDTVAQDIVNAFQVLQSVGPSLHPALLPKLATCLPKLRSYLENPYTGVRHMSARCVGTLAGLATADVMLYAVEKILPMMEASDNETQRQGASEAIANIIEVLGLDILPYIVLLIVPLLGRMTDQHPDVRMIATHCFASMIRLLPLEVGVPDPPDMAKSLSEQKQKERVFLEQLLDISKLENYTIDVPIKAELRKYQQDGVNWLGFLNKYKLHGILCDDMGLGKTLQSICIVATDHYRRAQKYKEKQSPDSCPLPSIVVCPPTLIGHWVYEVQKFIDREYLDPLMYAGTPSERQRLQKKSKEHNLIVASYDVVRNDIDFFGSINWNYCILDEGHIIKNGKTKISKAVKQLNCAHRLILSGTPIQNNVLDLWSLFDFLVPGFLGTEKQFQARYGKPILASREAKSSSKEQEAGALAMETLHRQVLPFILRRLKEDVLQDLPPKIIQDYYCDLSSLQIKLYEDFAKSQAKQGVEECVTSSKTAEQSKRGSTHVFQALQYLRKVCNHPALVLNANHPKYAEVMASLKSQGSNLRDLNHAPKLTALKQLLNDCGIGLDDATGYQDGNAPVVNQHRVLLFCQLKGMLDIVEHDLLKNQMHSVTYLRLDGSVPAGNRHDIVNRFNNDPSIDILLLTTHVGGLGLNLTGADTVIFVEHDWNPMKDLQAMDRAHRIGQKKVVNVYRLITRGTLEEKIMGLQKFKMTIANTVISADNASLVTMGTDQLLDLFALEDKKKGESTGSDDRKNTAEKRDTVKAILENLGELWDEQQYESEYDMNNFMKSLV
ncbi:TATA-binding protein-associated factor 172-like isoform X2 [Dreissena polymorpha]|uniref:TATA-binding protein-associated factor 172-like isoform X2 n=1 Tax=Dreissena polymorpha TaxID=45954 RepID=UPI0022640534|nr:TATA-binding protein-associated factor 172-like isoform X2 [Dreissena polymorpha]